MEAVIACCLQQNAICQFVDCWIGQLGYNQHIVFLHAIITVLLTGKAPCASLPGGHNSPI